MYTKTLDKLARLAIVLLLAGSVACSNGSNGSSPPPIEYTYAPPVDDGDSWSTAHAADEGLNVDRLESMMSAILSGRYALIDAIAISRNGKLVFDETIRTKTDAEDARVGNTELDVHAQFSTIKSVMALAVGIAIERGYLPGTDTPYLSLFPYPNYENWDERKNDITLGHVLAMRAGFDWDEWNPPYTSPDNQLIRFYATEVDYTKSLLDLPLAADPGSAFVYNTVASISLAQAIENSAPLTFVDFGFAELLQPLAIEKVEFLTTPTGLPNTGGGFYFRARDMAKFGQLVLNGGSWNGVELVSQAWIDEMLTARTVVGWSDPDAWAWQIDGYGYQWWLGHYEVGDTTLSTWAMWGFGGQWVVVVPDRQLVVVVNAHGYEDSDVALNQAHGLIREFVLAALGD